MKVRVLRSVLQDLAEARRFYDRKSDALGTYLFDSIFSDIDSLVLRPLKSGTTNLAPQGVYL